MKIEAKAEFRPTARGLFAKKTNPFEELVKDSKGQPRVRSVLGDDRMPVSGEDGKPLTETYTLIQFLDDGKPHQITIGDDEKMNTVVKQLQDACHNIDRSVRTQVPEGQTTTTAKTVVFQVTDRIIRQRTPKANGVTPDVLATDAPVATETATASD